MKLLRKIKFTETPSFVGTMEYLDTEKNRKLVPYLLQSDFWKDGVIRWESGNGIEIENMLAKYWEMYLEMTYKRSSSTSTHWDFIFGETKPKIEVETRRFSRENTMYLGFGNSLTADRRPWQEKAHLLQKGNGGYMGILMDGSLMNLFWFPAKCILEYHNGCGDNISADQISEYFDINVEDYLVGE